MSPFADPGRGYTSTHLPTARILVKDQIAGEEYLDLTPPDSSPSFGPLRYTPCTPVSVAPSPEPPYDMSHSRDNAWIPEQPEGLQPSAGNALEGEASSPMGKRKHEEAPQDIADRKVKLETSPANGRYNSTSTVSLRTANPHSPLQGTIQNPFEIESSPEPEPHAQSRRRKILPWEPVRYNNSLAAQPISGSLVQGGNVNNHGAYSNQQPVPEWLSARDLNYAKPTYMPGLATGNENRNPFQSANAGNDVHYQKPTTEQPAPVWPAGQPPQFSTMPPPINGMPFPDVSQWAYNAIPHPDTHDLPPPYSAYAHPAESRVPTGAPEPHALDEIPVEPEPILSAEQQNVVDLILQGHNVFYTGSAGCGKSTILKAFVKQLEERKKKVKIVAPTNLAALNVNGQTTWNFAGWTPDSLKRPLDVLKHAARPQETEMPDGTVKKSGEIWERFDNTDVLVIDEISMVDNHMFERLSEVMKASIGNKHGGGPFGGIQLVVTGDFCQLSPVKPFSYCIGCGWELLKDNQWRPTKFNCENPKCNQLEFFEIDKWAFRSNAWEECNFKHINLTEIHRQNDKKFISVLQRIRLDGKILKPHANLLLNHKSETEGAIRLFAKRVDVDRLNKEKIAQLPSPPLNYKCVDHFKWQEHHRGEKGLEKNTKLGDFGTLYTLKDHRYEIFVQLKLGMRVVLQSNLEPKEGLVNGSQGTIVGFEPYDPTKLPRPYDGNGKKETQIGPVLRGNHAHYAEEQVKIFAERNGFQSWPIVRFDNMKERTIFADCTVNEVGNEKEYSLLSRVQIPLVAGYAITVHKSQGMTLDRVVVNLAKAFEPSQIYVALSRARSLMGLKVEGLPRTDLGGANAQVKEFMETYLLKKKVETV